MKSYLKVIKNDLIALKTIKKVKNASKKDKTLRIAFIVQMPEIWDKTKPVYEELLKRNIETLLIIVPKFDFKKQAIGIEYGDELGYFSGLSNKYIKAYENGEWTNIDFSQFTYVFYQRPYDQYLPEHLRSNVVFKKSMVCYIPYCLWVFSLNYAAGAYNRDFFEHTYISFIETKENKDYLQKRINFLDILNIKNNIRHFYYLGYPQYQDIKISSQKVLNNGIRILWTPRWTNGYAGGSNFLDFKDKIFDLNNSYNSIIIRPHPLMFDNFIEKNMISQKEVDEYRLRLEETKILFDKNVLIEDTFKETDLLITDVSSIMMPYYLSGKPMIFCNHTEIELCQTYKDLLPTLYVANNWDDVVSIVEKLKNEGDWKYEERIKMINSYFPDFSQTSKRIVDKLIELSENSKNRLTNKAKGNTILTDRQIDRGIVYNKIIYELSKLKNKRYEKSIRKRLKNDKFSIICSNCIGGTIYNRLGKQFLSPTINLWMRQRDFIKFVLDLKGYIESELYFVNDEYDYPVALLRDIKIYFNHSKDKESAKRDWERRKTRINYDNLYIIMYDIEDITEKEILLLNNVNCKNKIVLSAKERPGISFVKTIVIDLDRQFGTQILAKDKYGIRTIEKQWDFVEFLNKK